VEIALTVPRECYLAKDYLNHKWHMRRLVYLDHVAQAISQRKLAKRGVRLTAQAGCLRTPGLLYTDVGTGRPVCILTALPGGLFNPSKLAPARNCLRAAAATSRGAAPRELLATPTYNRSVLADAFQHRLCSDLASALAPARLQAVACLCHHWLRAQVPASMHWQPLLEAALIALAAAAHAGDVVRSASPRAVCATAPVATHTHTCAHACRRST
jgi:hypothetical protein